MIEIVRTTAENEDFQELVKLLDEELNLRYGILQSQYDKYNKTADIHTVVVAYSASDPVGCGCFKTLTKDSVEIKRMFVLSDFRGTVTAALILHDLERWAKESGFLVSVLETGIKQPEAIKFYYKQGYQRIDNYGQYIGNENSVCMSKELQDKI